MDSLGLDDLKGIVAVVSRIMEEHRDHLIELDGLVGDGDLGLTMTKGFAAARDEAAASTESDAGKFFMKVGMAIARSAPSTMGTLVATGFMSGGKAIAGSERLDVAQLSAFLRAFVEGIMQRGKSKPGEKTIVDVLYPAAEALTTSAQRGEALPAAAEVLYRAGEAGLASTKDMIGQHGRVAYYQEQSRGKEDPGAVAGLLILQGLCDYIRSGGARAQ